LPLGELFGLPDSEFLTPSFPHLSLILYVPGPGLRSLIIFSFLEMPNLNLDVSPIYEFELYFPGPGINVFFL